MEIFLDREYLRDGVKVSRSAWKKKKNNSNEMD